jgi:hypothetical protein
MMMHPAIDDLKRWRRGEIGEEEMIAIADHLSTCQECVAGRAPLLGLERAAVELCDELEGAEEHPDVESHLFAFVDGTATAGQRGRIEEHLALCVFCKDSVAELRRLVAKRRQQPLRPWLLALAASIVLAAVSSVWLRMTPPPRGESTPRILRTTPVPVPAVPLIDEAPVDEAETFADAIRGGGRIGLPRQLLSVLGEADVLRGASMAAGPLEPAGVVVTSARPRFTWPALAGARSVVEIFSGETEVARSPALGTDRWTPPRDLPRGVTYTWTVRVEHDGTSEILPAAPSPVARFHVLGRATFAALESARQRHGADHFLLGVLYARAGLVDKAKAHLREVTDPADAAIAGRILHDIDSWYSHQP